jgi:hypothetical protein
MRPTLSTTEVLNDAADAVTRVAAPWMGLLWMLSLPLRLCQAHFVARVIDLGPESGQYGAHLFGIALAAAAALLPALWARAVFVRALGLSLRRAASPGAAALCVPAASLACYVYAALAIEVLFFALGWTLVALPLLMVMGGLAAAIAPLCEQPGLVRPFREIARHLSHGRVLVGLVTVFAIAFFVVFINLLFVFALGLWLAGAIPGLDPAPWQVLLDFGNERYLLVLCAGALLAVEPFWLGACVVYVHKVRSRQSGEDLRLWFERLRSEAA